MEKIKIVYTNHSLGNNFGDVIELNEDLKKYPVLHDSILKHELSHTQEQFTLKDLKLDLTESRVNSFQLLKFMLRYPKSLFQFLPFYYSRKHGFVKDINYIIIYSFVLAIFISCYFIFKSIV